MSELFFFFLLPFCSLTPPSTPSLTPPPLQLVPEHIQQNRAEAHSDLESGPHVGHFLVYIFNVMATGARVGGGGGGGGVVASLLNERPTLSHPKDPFVCDVFEGGGW